MKRQLVTIPGAVGNIYFSTEYSGAATGQTTVENEATRAIKISNAGVMGNKAGWTINDKSTRYASTNATSDQRGRTISFRYNTDNTMDIFDETTEEVIFTADSNLDGNGVQSAYVMFRGDRHMQICLGTLHFKPTVNPGGGWVASDLIHQTGENADTGVNDYQQIVPLRTWEDVGFSGGGRQQIPTNAEMVDVWSKDLSRSRSFMDTTSSIIN